MLQRLRGTLSKERPKFCQLLSRFCGGTANSERLQGAVEKLKSGRAGGLGLTRKPYDISRHASPFVAFTWMQSRAHHREREDERRVQCVLVFGRSLRWGRRSFSVALRGSGKDVFGK